LVRFSEPGENLIFNGDFSQDSDYCELDISDSASAEGFVEDRIYHIQIDISGVRYSDVQLRQDNLEIIESREYVLEFDAWSSEPKYFYVRVRKSSDPFTDYSKIGAVYSTTGQQHFTYEFTMDNITDYSAQMVFECGQSAADLFIDNVSLYYLSETPIEHTNHLPANYKLYSNYPNPFNPSTMIKYQLPMASDVDLSIYNLLGQKVATLINELQGAGSHQVEWDASRFSSGVYYYRIEAGEFQDVKKMVLLK
jgi:Fe-S cluster assembly iron-binding protein IscA